MFLSVSPCLFLFFARQLNHQFVSRKLQAVSLLRLLPGKNKLPVENFQAGKPLQQFPLSLHFLTIFFPCGSRCAVLMRSRFFLYIRIHPFYQGITDEWTKWKKKKRMKNAVPFQTPPNLLFILLLFNALSNMKIEHIWEYISPLYPVCTSSFPST